MAAVEAALCAFAEPLSASETQRTYQLTAASIWRARRQGLSLAEIVQTLETYSSTDIPAPVRADIERWSEQIERLTLGAEQDRLILRSPNPQAITAVRHHRILGGFIHHQVDETTLALRAETYPELVQTFDAYYHPLLDRVPQGWTPIAPAADTSARRGRPTVRRSPRHALEGSSPSVAPREAGSHVQSPPTVSSPTGAGPGSFVDVLRLLSRQCRATTKAGRQCKNRARPPSPFCRVHAEQRPGRLSLDALIARQVLELMIESGLLTLPQLALIRVGILVGLGLGSWLLYALLMTIGGWFHLSLASWFTAGLTMLLTCGLVGRLVWRIGLLTTLSILLVLLTSLLVDFFHKEGLVLNLCFVLIPLVMPAAIVYQYGLSLWWSCLLVPLGFVLGSFFHHFLEGTVL